MRRLTFLLACLAACGDNIDPTPVDMAYDVRVIQLDQDCGGTPLPDDARAFLDLQLHVDGHVQMTGWVPSLLVQPSFLHLFPTDGRVDDDNRDQYGELYHVHGALTMDAMDLTLDAPGYRPDGSGTPCRQRVRLQGASRGFLDAASLDGSYPLKAEYYGIVCGTDPLPAAPLGTGTYRVDGRPRDGTLFLDLEDSFWFSGPQPDASGQVDWSGTFTLYGEVGLIDAPGTFKGTFRPDEVRATLEFDDGQIGSGCRYHYELSGAKHVASLVSRAGAYRGVLRTYDTCEDPPMPIAYEEQIDVIDWYDGRVAVYDAGGGFLIGRDGDALYATAGSKDFGEIQTFTGTVSPPFLSYTFDDTYQVGSDWCSIGWDVDAVARYFPDQPWTPAFQPDPPKTTLPSSARKAPFISDLAPRVTFGPLARLSR